MVHRIIILSLGFVMSGDVRAMVAVGGVDSSMPPLSQLPTMPR
jgi:hypothetical protein